MAHRDDPRVTLVAPAQRPVLRQHGEEDDGAAALLEPEFAFVPV
jgi:hypothetical protein